VGQQQLLLLTLGTIIVGFATLVGIEAYDRLQHQAAAEQMTQKALEIAIDVQTYAKRPAHMRLSNSTAEDDDDELVVGFSELLKYDTEDDGTGGDDYFTEWAQYSLDGSNSLPEGYNEDACPDNDPVNTVNAYSEQHDVSVCVGIAGPSKDDLEAGVAE
jgi:hypothetical protein